MSKADIWLIAAFALTVAAIFLTVVHWGLVAAALVAAICCAIRYEKEWRT